MREVVIHGNRYYNGDCVEGCREHVVSGSVDLVVTDPPYGIGGDRLHKHYNRDEGHVVDGYVEVPMGEYYEFSRRWVAEAARILRPNGCLYIVSGYTNLWHILDALRETDLQEVNHLIWRYNFGVYTKRKFVSSHYHVLFYERPGPGRRTFNVESRFGLQERDGLGGSLNYQDREDVWVINREYKPGQEKNKNELPTALLQKMIQYSSNEDDLVCDMFMGGFSTARVAVGLNRRFVGFELSKGIFDRRAEAMGDVEVGGMLEGLRMPGGGTLANQGKPWSDEEVTRVIGRFGTLTGEGRSKAEAVRILVGEMGRGRFAIEKVLKRHAEEQRDRPKVPDITKY